jgi:hypothetical protein
VRHLLGTARRTQTPLPMRTQFRVTQLDDISDCLHRYVWPSCVMQAVAAVCWATGSWHGGMILVC